MAQAQRDFQLQQAQCDAAVSARKAQADLAYQLQVGGGCGTTPPPIRGCYPLGGGEGLGTPPAGQPRPFGVFRTAWDPQRPLGVG